MTVSLAHAAHALSSFRAQLFKFAFFNKAENPGGGETAMKPL